MYLDRGVYKRYNKGIMDKNQIRELRIALRLTQQEFALKLGVALMTVSRWETGAKTPSLRNLRKIEELKAKVGE